MPKVQSTFVVKVAIKNCLTNVEQLLNIEKNSRYALRYGGGNDKERRTVRNAEMADS